MNCTGYNHDRPNDGEKISDGTCGYDSASINNNLAVLHEIVETSLDMLVNPSNAFSKKEGVVGVILSFLSVQYNAIQNFD